MYIRYLKYVLRHKYYVMKECFELAKSRGVRSLYWRGIVHDLSKFLPDEFIPYARYFYGDYPSWNKVKFIPGWTSKTKEDVEKDFDIAWLKHQKRNKHHWQYWLLQEDDGGLKTLKMPEQYMLEMVADWHGAGMAIHGKKETDKWYEKNYLKMKLHIDTRNSVEWYIGMCFIWGMNDYEFAPKERLALEGLEETKWKWSAIK